MEQDWKEKEIVGQKRIDLWNTIVQVTDRIGGEKVKGIRIFLYIVLISGKYCNFQNHLRYVRKNVFLFSKVNKVRKIRVAKYHPLFAFVHDTPSNMNNILPVFRSAQRKGWNPTILAGNRVNIDLQEYGKLVTVIKYLDLLAITKIKERIRAWRQAFRCFNRIFDGFQAINREIADQIKSYQFEIITEIAFFIVFSIALQRFYERIKPKCVVSTSDLWPFEHAIFAEARGAGIPSFVIQHGTITPFWWPFIADKLLTWGEPFRDEIIRLGAPASRLAICGMPATDSIFLN